ncbi:DUF5462 family protein [Providencia sp. PROV111]|uniref:DUF5462 family protein n=1 Tax=Providencia sp. PROV111 TaxID=2949822 RepID=UPI002349EE66|nr:DUF5462 family protein [Providencia sp. PROV111]
MNGRCEHRTVSRYLMAGLFLSGAMSAAALGNVDENIEALGVINGSVMQRGVQTELNPALSGRPLFRYDAEETQPGITQVLIAHAELVPGMHNAETDRVWVQLPAELVNDPQATGVWQLPLQVSADGKTVPISAQADSRGVTLTWAPSSRRITVNTAGVPRLTVPTSYRGDIRTDIRMVEVLPTTEE